MITVEIPRTLVADLSKTESASTGNAADQAADGLVCVKGWVHALRVLSKTTFVVLKDCSGQVQCVGSTAALKDHHLKIEDVIQIKGKARVDTRSRSGFEIDIVELKHLNRASENLPFITSQDLKDVSQEVILDYRPLSMRNDKIQNTFKIQARILEAFRSYLTRNRFTEIVTSKIVGGGTEGGTNLFQIKYFDRSAYLAQSPQFYKEYGTAAFERVFETAHVYRAEPHATRRHLTEYYSLDLEFGFVDSVFEVMDFEEKLVHSIFQDLNANSADILQTFGRHPLPEFKGVLRVRFNDALKILETEYGRKDLMGDLDPEGERQLCLYAKAKTGISAMFVYGFPLNERPFYTHGLDMGDANEAASFDLLYEGLEITTGGKRLHTREGLEAALKKRKIDHTQFEHHLRMYDLGMPPHGGLAIGLERLTSQILGLENIREATMYPRDRHRLTP